MLSAVVDTNVLVSGIINAHGAPSKVLTEAMAGRFRLITSRPLIVEFEEVSLRSRIASKYPQGAKRRREIFAFLRDQSIGETPRRKRVIITEDPVDDAILDCAVAAGADCIVSGDSHLLRLKRFQGIPILTPKQFLDTLAKGGINGPG